MIMPLACDPSGDHLPPPEGGSSSNSASKSGLQATLAPGNPDQADQATAEQPDGGRHGYHGDAIGGAGPGCHGVGTIEVQALGDVHDDALVATGTPQIPGPAGLVMHLEFQHAGGGVGPDGVTRGGQVVVLAPAEVTQVSTIHEITRGAGIPPLVAVIVRRRSAGEHGILGIEAEGAGFQRALGADEGVDDEAARKGHTVITGPHQGQGGAGGADGEELAIVDLLALGLARLVLDRNIVEMDGGIAPVHYVGCIRVGDAVISGQIRPGG